MCKYSIFLVTLVTIKVYSTARIVQWGTLAKMISPIVELYQFTLRTDNIREQNENLR